MVVANSSVKSLTGSLSVVAGTTAVDGTFGETVSGGKVSAIDMSLFLKSDGRNVALQMLIVGGRVYLGGTGILAALGAGDKKWALASTSSSNSALKSLGTQLSGYLDTGSANQYALYGQAARTVLDQGPVTLGTVKAHKFFVTADVAKLIPLLSGPTRTSMQAAVDAGVTTLPTTIWLDSSDRLVQASSTVKFAGVTSASVFKVSAYDVAVAISPPASSDVYTG